MEPGIAGIEGETVIVLQTCGVELQLLLALTQIFPELDPEVMVIEFVPCPDVIVAPDGTVQLYVVADETGTTEYAILDCPEHIEKKPFINPIVPTAGLGATKIDLQFEAALVPQPFSAVTQTDPEALPNVMLTLFVP
jgi:hypothetical protein